MVDSTTVTVLLLGDSGCGKTTFLSRLKAPKPLTENIQELEISLLKDHDQPFIYDVRFSKKSFRVEVYDTASPNQHWSSLRPDLVILAYDISDRTTLDSLKGWRSEITRYFQSGSGERIPVMMLGLKRDLRTENDQIIYPQEACRIAQELHCDRYAECSAVTGELIAEAFEDIAKMAAMTTIESGAQSEGGCTII
ncbi:putative Rho-like small GTPase [Talaromyces proteolyticus]|uniref:Rho-like small GTPase n=1 Tax=Talaromyces proteolyticus TaxID=1131652 RepID=A0AAD4KSB1_9EURO|nr:putative Rho-like small GTPase [Talaromyces proteolyticus]KAH8695432.1 putative Rho-like small GTPase [Talaromyces proteolyticus]